MEINTTLCHPQGCALCLGEPTAAPPPPELDDISRGVGPPFSHSGTHCGVLVEAAMAGEWPEMGMSREHFIPGVRPIEAAPLLSFLIPFWWGLHSPSLRTSTALDAERSSFPLWNEFFRKDPRPLQALEGCRISYITGKPGFLNLETERLPKKKIQKLRGAL